VSPEPEINITHNTCFMPPCSIAISQAKWHSLWRMHRIRHLPFALALKSANDECKRCRCRGRQPLIGANGKA